MYPTPKIWLPIHTPPTTLSKSNNMTAAAAAAAATGAASNIDVCPAIAPFFGYLGVAVSVVFASK